MLDTGVTVNVCVWLAAPELIPLRLTVCKPELSLIVRLRSAFNVGYWFTGLTVTAKLCVTILLLNPPLFTVTITVAVL